MRQRVAPAPRRRRAQFAPGHHGAWQRLARKCPELGRSETFCGEPELTAWHSFTVTLYHSEFYDCMEGLSGNASGTDGLVTFADSAWRTSIVMARQPHFRNQPAGTYVFWGYGLNGNRHGNAVDSTMSDATGDGILTKLAAHLKLDARQAHWFDGARIILCRMPFITSQFMPRAAGDRPPVRPQGAQNFA